MIILDSQFLFLGGLCSLGGKGRLFDGVKSVCFCSRVGMGCWIFLEQKSPPRLSGTPAVLSLGGFAVYVGF